MLMFGVLEIYERGFLQNWGGEELFVDLGMEKNYLWIWGLTARWRSKRESGAYLTGTRAWRLFDRR